MVCGSNSLRILCLNTYERAGPISRVSNSVSLLKIRPRFTMLACARHTSTHLEGQVSGFPTSRSARRCLGDRTPVSNTSYINSFCVYVMGGMSKVGITRNVPRVLFGCASKRGDGSADSFGSVSIWDSGIVRCTRPECPSSGHAKAPTSQVMATLVLCSAQCTRSESPCAGEKVTSAWITGNERLEHDRFSLPPL